MVPFIFINRQGCFGVESEFADNAADAICGICYFISCKLLAAIDKMPSIAFFDILIVERCSIWSGGYAGLIDTRYAPCHSIPRCFLTVILLL